MARPPRPENADNALRQLRALTSAQGEKLRIPQPQLARAIGVPVSTLRGIEANQRKLNADILEKVELHTGAYWDEDEKRWMFARLEGRPVRFNYRLYEQYDKMMKEVSPDMRDQDLLAIKLRVDALFGLLPARLWLVLLNRIQNLLDDCRRELAEGLIDDGSAARLRFIFDMTKSGFTFTFDRKTKNVDQFKRFYPLRFEQQPPKIESKRIAFGSGLDPLTPH